MGRLWRAGKSRMVKQIRNAPTKEALLQLMPDNLQSVDDWMDFVKEKTSANFMVMNIYISKNLPMIFLKLLYTSI